MWEQEKWVKQEMGGWDRPRVEIGMEYKNARVHMLMSIKTYKNKIFPFLKIK